jgi:hypothetical protein
MIVKGVQKAEVEVSVNVREFLDALSHKLVGVSLNALQVNEEGKLQKEELSNYHRGEYDWVDCEYQNPTRIRRVKLLQDLYEEAKDAGLK